MAAEKSEEGRDQKSKEPRTLAERTRTSKPFQELGGKAGRKIPLHATSEAETAATIHELRMRNEELVESNKRLQRVLECGSAGTWNWDVQAERIEWNEQMYEMVGLSPDVREITVEAFFHYIHPKDLPRVQENIAKALESGTDFREMFRIVREDGEVRWLSGRGRVFRDEQAKPVRMMGVHVDITERQQTAEAVRLERQKLKNILDSIPDAVYIVNRQGEIEYVNPEMEKQRGSWAGEKCHQYRVGRDEPCTSCKFDQIRSGETVRAEWTDERIGKTYDCIDAPLTNPDGSVSKLKIMRDVTEAKRAKEKLQQEHREIRLANRILEMFVNETGNTLYDKVLALLLEAMKSQYGVFGYVDEQKSLICPTMSRVLDECEMADKCIRYTRDNWKGLWSRALLEKRTLYTNDAPVIPTGHLPICNNMATPILFQGEAIGLFNFANKAGGYTEQDRRFIEAMAARIAPVLYAWVQRELREKEREQAEAALRETKNELERNVAQLRTTFDSLTEGLIISDLDGNLFHWNPAAVAMHGFSNMEECRRKLPEFAEIFELSTEADGVLPVERWPLARILRGETLRNWEVHLHRCGSNWHRIFNYGGTLARDRNGKPLLAVVSCADVTDRKHAAEQIQMVAKFPSENPSPVLRIASDGAILYSNEPGLSLLDEWDRKVGQKAPRDWCRRVSRALGSGKNVIDDVKCGERIISLEAAPVVEGGYVNVYGRDITRERKADQALRRAHTDLEKKVQKRTVELARTVEVLRQEVEHRMRAEQFVREQSRDLEQSEARYRALVELSPDPVLVVAGDRIAFANPACVELAGLGSANELVGQEIWGFVHPDSRRAAETLLRAALRGRKKIALTELKTLRPDGRTVEVEVSAAPIRYKAELAVQALIRDISERKRAQARASVTRVLLELFAQKASKKEYLDSVVEIIRVWSGCRCVGIRLINAEGQIPYESYVGFGKEYLSEGRVLCLNKDTCVCTRVATQAPDPQDAQAMTKRGSFRCDNMLRFVESLTEAEKARYRGTCLKHGFASVVVVPIRYRHKACGAIHLADESENKVPLENVQFMENMATLIGEAVHRFSVEQALRLSESRLVEAQRMAHLGNWDWDIVKNTLWWSDEVYRIFGLEPQQFGATNEAFLSCVHPEDRELVKEAMNEAVCSHKTHSIGYRVIRPDGSERIVHEQAEVLYDKEKKPVRMMGTVQDVTEFKQAEERILADQVALRSLTSELQLAEERERRRLARDLHDSLGQILAMSKREIVGLQKSAPAKTAASLKAVANQLDQAIKEARTLSFELSPSVLYDLGFEVALEELAERFYRERKIDCRFENNDEPKPLEEAIAVLLYRSVRELLINVAKHANATTAKISLERIENKLHITVEDNGDGFDVSVLDSQSRQPKGFGVLSVRERLRHIGGHFEIQSGNGSGTKVTLVAPLRDKENMKQDTL